MAPKCTECEKDKSKELISAEIKYICKDFRKVDGIPCAIFSVELKTVFKPANLTMKAESTITSRQTGEVALSINGRLKIYEKLSGPTKLNGAGRLNSGAYIKVTGAGKMDSMKSIIMKK